MRKTKFNINDLYEYYICPKFFSLNKKRKISEFNAVNNIIGQLYLYKQNTGNIAPISVYTNIFQKYIIHVSNIQANRIIALNNLLMNYYNNIYSIEQNIILCNKVIYFRNDIIDIGFYIPIFVERNNEYFIHWCITNETLFDLTFDIKRDFITNLTGHLFFNKLQKRVIIKNEIYNLITEELDHIYINKHHHDKMIDFIQYISYGIIKEIQQPHYNSYCQNCEFKKQCVFGS